MNGLSVVLVAFFTSVFTAAGTVYVMERWDVFERRSQETTVPDLRGLSEQDARANLQAANLSLLVGAREPSLTAKPGTVLSQSVPAGQNLPPRHPVTVVFAAEAPRAPSLTGLDVEAAKKKLAAQGFQLEVGAPVAHETVPEGKIAAQAPEADAPHDKARPIVVQLSSGAGAVDMPKVVGISVDRAKAELEKLGLKLAPVRWTSMPETSTYVVLSQKPAAGEKVKPGTEVELSANR